MKPFQDYPLGGVQMLGRIPDSGNCRRGYGLKLQILTKQTQCAYCGMSLVDTYEHWLLLTIDHVIPTGQGAIVGIPDDWLKDYANAVLCCSACNGFCNRFRLPEGTSRPPDFRGFTELRDEIFRQRMKALIKAHEKERAFYTRNPWHSQSIGS